MSVDVDHAGMNLEHFLYWIGQCSHNDTNCFLGINVKYELKCALLNSQSLSWKFYQKCVIHVVEEIRNSHTPYYYAHRYCIMSVG